MVGYKIISTTFGEVVLGGKDGKISFCYFALPSVEAIIKRVEREFPRERIAAVSGSGNGVLSGNYTEKELLQGRGVLFRWEDFHLEGTPLQMAVWRELFNIGEREMLSYSELALRCGYPRAVRAVATAVGKNPINLIIPCHRVVRKGGAIGNYAWGVDLKLKILRWEGLIL